MAFAAEQLQPQQQQPTTLEFYQAMSDFKNMFPQMDDDVIEAVLRSNQGAVDMTIDQLLSMSTDNENEKIRSEIEENEDLPSRNIKLTTFRAESTRKIKNWQPPLIGPLPHSFLRISFQEVDSINSLNLNSGQDFSFLEDESFAFFLQNKEFMTELRWNEDFMSTLKNDSKLQEKSESDDEEDLFKERLKNMGKASKKKFAQLTKVFTRNKKRDGLHLLPPSASCDDLLNTS
ncbi:CUE domain-containing protein 1 [Copidosoma floridanum]|uniref:CUE domain-containing protein 1 n=1 Tax=Copidosoma floridanum TaxID=29053 RepID=UPI0006C9D310|nr:CUE domain-containing protein 1 [Copidosoma floridanum]